MVERLETSPICGLCEEIIEQLETAVLIVDGGALRLLHANGYAREMLGVTVGELPKALTAALSEWLASAPPRLRFCGARSLTAPSGERFQARAKLLDPKRREVLLMLTPHLAHDRDVGAALRERFLLSRREVQVVLGVRAGMTNSEIALRFGLSEGTVKNYLSRAFAAIGVRSRTHLVAFLRSLGPEE